MPNTASSLPPEIQRRIDRLEAHIRQADRLEADRRVDEALAAYKACFDLAQRERIPFLVDHLIHIWMGVGFCYADRNDWKAALQMYRLVEAVLQSAPSRLDPQSADAQAQAQKWAKLLPAGLHLLYPESFNPDPHFAVLYESMGLACDNAGQTPQAQEYFRKSLGLHTRLDDEASAARVWHSMAVGAHRRQDWETLSRAARRMLELNDAPDDLAERLTAYRFLAQANWNQMRMLDALAYLNQAETAARQLQGVDQAGDQQAREEFVETFGQYLRERQAKGLRPGPGFDPDRLRPYTGLFTKITVEKADDQGAGACQFVLHTPRFDDARQALQVFHLACLPVDLEFLRRDGGRWPKDADLMIEWQLADPEPGQPIGRALIPRHLHAALAEANARSLQFTLVLQEEKAGLFGKTRREPLPQTYAPYLLDWHGVEGIAVIARSAWAQADHGQVGAVLGLLNQRLQERGPATGLFTQMGFVYRVAGDLAQAEACYLEEIKLGLLPDGRPGLGALTALCNLGTVYKKRAELENARAAYRLALHLNPNYYEPLVSVAGAVEDFGLQLLCLSRAYRIRPDERMITTAVESMCRERPEAAGDVLRLIKETSRAVDLTQPMPELALADPAATLRELAPQLFLRSQSGPEQMPPPAGPIDSLQAAAHVLQHFAAAHCGPPQARPGALEPARWSVSVSEMTEFGRNGAIRKVEGVELQLSRQPEELIRVALQAGQCQVRLMQAVQIPNVPQTALKSVHSESIPAQTDTLLSCLDSLLARGLLRQTEGALRITA